MNNMKALIINEFGGPEQLQLTELPVPSGKPGEVLVRIYAAGVNPVDYKMRKGLMSVPGFRKFPRMLKNPIIPGRDIAGIVQHAGSESLFRKGDRVFAMVDIKRGGYAQYTTVSENHLCFIPRGISMTAAAATPLASLTALQALHTLQTEGKSLKGKKILINGASGGVGSFAVQIGKALGANITGVCSSANIKFVKSLGADRVIDYTSEDFTRQDVLYNMVFDSVAKSSFSESKTVLHKDGVYVSTLPNRGILLHIALNFLRDKKARLLIVKPSRENLLVISGLMKRRLVKPYIQKVFPLHEGARAHEMIESERVKGKIVLRVR
jgi:NADPH:quinone reductase-like Zn-dependent oxidoreductase